MPSTIALPTHSGELPVIKPGNACTVTVAYTTPQPVVYVTLAVPAATPVSRPLVVISATDAGEQVHIPPASVLPSTILLPTHTGTFPVIAPGKGFTVTIAIEGPHDVLYTTTAVPPDSVVTRPLLLTVATAAGLQLHVPPGRAQLRLTVPPWHTGALPVIGSGVALTVTTVLTELQVVT